VDLTYIALIGLFLAFMFMGVRLIYVFLFGVVINAFGQSILRVVITSETIGLAPRHATGEVMGVMTSVMSLSMVFAPIMAGFVFDFEPRAIYLLAAGFALAAFFLAFANKKRLEEAKAVENTEIPNSI
jgi:MFS family permease